LRPRVLAASVSLVLILSGRVVVETIQNRPPDHEHPSFGVPGARQLAVKPFTTLPKGLLFLRLENFSTTKAAEDAATLAKLALWLSGPERSGCSRLAQWAYGLPVGHSSRRLDRFRRSGRGRLRAGHQRSRFRPRDEGASCAASPSHPGPEIFYLLTGEQCLETPNGTTRARAGEGMVAPAHTHRSAMLSSSSFAMRRNRG
jgi:hypothetical protein